MTKGRRIYITVSWVLVVICVAIIFCLSAQNAEESSDLSGSFVKVILEWLNIDIDEDILRAFAHGLEFMGLSLLTFNAVYVTWKPKLIFLIAWLGTTCYAITDEIHQIFVPGRAFQISDILVDSTGAFVGALASFIILKVILTIKKRGNKNGNIKTI